MTARIGTRMAILPPPSLHQPAARGIRAVRPQMRHLIGYEYGPFILLEKEVHHGHWRLPA
jgi:hypothetical protein